MPPAVMAHGKYFFTRIKTVCAETDREPGEFFLQPSHQDLPISSKNVAALIEYGRRRWKIENEGFNIQKKHGYYLEHLFSRNYQAMKNHYYLMHI